MVAGLTLGPCFGGTYSRQLFHRLGRRLTIIRYLGDVTIEVGGVSLWSIWSTADWSGDACPVSPYP